MTMPMMVYADPASVAQIEEYMPMFANASFVGDLSFQNGKTVLGLQLFGSEEMMNYVKEYYATPSGKFMSYIPSTSAVVGSFAVKNLPATIKLACDMNSEYAQVFAKLKNDYGLDEEFFAGISGDIVFAVDGKNLIGANTPGFIFIMECDRNVWSFIQDGLVGNAEYVGTDMFRINNQIYIAYDNGYVIVADAATMNVGPFDASSSFAGTALAKEIANGGMVINLEALPREVLDAYAREVDYSMTGKDLLDLVNSVVITSYDNNMSAKLILNMGDKQHNFLEKLILDAIPSI